MDTKICTSLEELRQLISTLPKKDFEILIQCILSTLYYGEEPTHGMSIRHIQDLETDYVTIWYFHPLGSEQAMYGIQCLQDTILKSGYNVDDLKTSFYGSCWKVEHCDILSRIKLWKEGDFLIQINSNVALISLVGGTSIEINMSKF